MERKIVACDFCHEIRMAVNKCNFCNKDICNGHTHVLSIDFFHPKNRYIIESEGKEKPIILKISINYSIGDRDGIRVCKNCAERYINMFEILSKGKKEHIIKELMDKVEELAKIEAI